MLFPRTLFKTTTTFFAHVPLQLPQATMPSPTSCPPPTCPPSRAPPTGATPSRNPGSLMSSSTACVRATPGEPPQPPRGGAHRDRGMPGCGQRRGLTRWTALLAGRAWGRAHTRWCVPPLGWGVGWWGWGREWVENGDGCGGGGGGHWSECCVGG